MNRDDSHVCVVWCILHPMTCSFAHTIMLQCKRATDMTYPRAQPRRKFEKEEGKGSKKPSRSTKQVTTQRATPTKGD